MRAVIAESYERIHRSNLVGMGILPLEYLPGQSAETLGLTGKETYTILVPEDLQTGQIIDVQVCIFLLNHFLTYTAILVFSALHIAV